MRGSSFLAHYVRTPVNILGDIESEPQNMVAAACEGKLDYPHFLLRKKLGHLLPPRPGVPVRLHLGSPSLCPDAPHSALLSPAGGGELRPGASLLQVTPQHLSAEKGWGPGFPASYWQLLALPCPAQHRQVTYTGHEAGQV